jgi:hypothetical protein
MPVTRVLSWRTTYQFVRRVMIVLRQVFRLPCPPLLHLVLFLLLFLVKLHHRLVDLLRTHRVLLLRHLPQRKSKLKHMTMRMNTIHTIIRPLDLRYLGPRRRQLPGKKRSHLLIQPPLISPRLCLRLPSALLLQHRHLRREGRLDSLSTC